MGKLEMHSPMKCNCTHWLNLRHTRYDTPNDDDGDDDDDDDDDDDYDDDDDIV